MVDSLETEYCNDSIRLTLEWKERLKMKEIEIENDESPKSSKSISGFDGSD